MGLGCALETLIGNKTFQTMFTVLMRVATRGMGMSTTQCVTDGQGHSRKAEGGEMKLREDYAVIETAEEASVFQELIYDMAKNGVDWYEMYKTKRGPSRVLAAITPAEGDAVFWWDKSRMIDPGYLPRLSDHWLWHESRGCTKVKANSLTIGKSVGELRELLAWAKGEA